MPVNVPCNHCGEMVSVKPHQALTGKSIYCSRECYRLAKRKGSVIVCAHCGKSVYLQPSRIKRGERYCSYECYVSDNTVTKVCQTCGKNFTVSASTAHRYVNCSFECTQLNVLRETCERCGKVFRGDKRYPRHYCSEECRRPPMIVTCKHCGQEFRKIPGDEDRQFCSLACYRRYRGENLFEKAIRESLERLRVEYIQEAKMGRYSVDFLLPKLGIALEADGKYWHIKTAERDKKKDAYLVRKGWFVCRISETELTNAVDVDEFISERVKVHQLLLWDN